MGAPEILYRLVWSWPGEGNPEFTALVNHAASMDLARVLEAQGATVDRYVPERRPATAPQTADDDRDGGYHPDASDSAAFARLGRRAFDRNAGLGPAYRRQYVDPDPADRGHLFSNGNGTEFS